MGKLRRHKVDRKTFRAVSKHRFDNGWWNSAMLAVTTECGETDPGIITRSWDRTDCLRCLKKRPARSARERGKG